MRFLNPKLLPQSHPKKAHAVFNNKTHNLQILQIYQFVRSIVRELVLGDIGDSS